MSTYRFLLHYHYEIQRLEKDASVLLFLNLSKAKQFYKNHNIKINAVLEKLGKIEQRYFVFNDKQVVMEEVKEGQKPLPILQEGMKREDYDIETKEYLDTPYQINI